MRTGDKVYRGRAKAAHIVARDTTITVCGQGTEGIAPLPDGSKMKVCARCKSGPDHSSRRGAAHETTDMYLERQRKSQTSRLPVDPKERQEHLRFLAKVEWVRKQFDAEVVA